MNDVPRAMITRTPRKNRLSACLRVSVLMLLGYCGAAAHAQTLYKCVNANGRTSYQAEPCVDAKQSTVRQPDPVAAKTPEQQKAAEEKTAKEVESAMDRIGNTMADMSLCQGEVPGFDEKHAAAFQEWKARNGADLERFYADAAARARSTARVEADRARLAADKAALASRCAQVAAALQGGPARAAKK